MCNQYYGATTVLNDNCYPRYGCYPAGFYNGCRPYGQFFSYPYPYPNPNICPVVKAYEEGFEKGFEIGLEECSKHHRRCDND